MNIQLVKYNKAILSLVDALVLRLFELDVICDVFLQSWIDLQVISANSKVVKIKELLHVDDSPARHFQDG